MGVVGEVTGKAKVIADAAGKKTETIVEFSKLKLSCLTLNSDLNKAYQRLGIIAFDVNKNAPKDGDSAIAACVSDIDKIKEKLSLAEDKLRGLKGTFKCSGCGNQNSMESKFCSRCGEKVSK